VATGTLYEPSSLSAAVYTESPCAAFRFREAVRSGMVSINNSTSGAEAHLPFGVGSARSSDRRSEMADEALFIGLHQAARTAQTPT
jgi:acyl-CoA reductase-like NAD-dependent aldehyde dehydrogenase